MSGSSASKSSVAAALSSIISAPEGEPAVKKAHTGSEEVFKGMSPDNQALLSALTAVIEGKMEKRLDRIDRAMEAMAQATDNGLQEVKKQLEKVKVDIKAKDDMGPKEVTASSGYRAPRACLMGAKTSFVPTKVFVQGFYNFA